MLLIIILGLIAKLTSVSGDCTVRTQDMKYFDWYKFSGPRPWYALLHTPNSIENDLDCVSAIWASPEGNTSLITVKAYQISKQSLVTVYGNATNWNGTGYWDEDFQQFTIWLGRHYVIAFDYERYLILKQCPIDSNTPRICVLYRSLHPDNQTVKKAKEELQENNIDVNQLENWPADHCQQEE